jgi:hypothetical protein
VSHYDIVPKDFKANLKFRSSILAEAAGDKSMQATLHQMCTEDILFWWNTFVWTYNPKDYPDCPARPFITWDYQDRAILDINECVGKEDLGSEKSRDMGLSWIMLGVIRYRWQFVSLQSFLLVSRVEDLVDKKNEPDCLFWKIDFVNNNLPRWLMPEYERQKLSLSNIENQSTITGASTTSETARGGRKTAILLDEFASVADGYAMLKATRDTTNTRLFNSTPKGSGNAFYDIMHNTSIRKLRFHWTLHPLKSAGLYKDDRGKPRSPWYDLQCERAAHPMEIAQELDIDYLGSDFAFFDADLCDQISKDCIGPYFRANLDYDRMHGSVKELQMEQEGELRFWIYPDEMGQMPDDRTYVVGADVASGTGASNSCLIVLDRKTGEQVMEYVNPYIRPEAFAELTVAVGWLFKGKGEQGAHLIWEANGPGRNFGDRVIEMGYTNIYYRRSEKVITKKVTNFPGWWSTNDTKLQVMGSYRRGLSLGQVVMRSAEQLHECRELIFTAQGTVEHAKAISTIDPSGAKHHHGDRPTAGALAWHAMTQTVEPEETEPIAPPGSLAWRREVVEAEARQENYW